MANATEIKKDPKRITIGSKEFPVRYSYAAFFTPKEDEDGKIDKKTGKPLAFYSCQVIIDKEDEASVEAINAAVRAAVVEKIGDKKTPITWKLPLRDGDEEYEEKGEHLKGMWFLNCKSKGRPNVVGVRKYTEEDLEAWDDENEMQSPDYKAKNRPKLGKLIPLKEDELKSGDYGRISLNMYYFETESKGIAVGLGNVQKLKDGDSLGGTRSSAEEDFADIEEGFDD